ncbi:hypothetical protein LTR37_008930 [Vermiconidia calcicola]|uniref:Uncharacterized protein n=1 Tax=Vermiconidia calcicola TaxID=1690605 RepID=A0ACC3N9H7_9PEZI|nr:hypothetical protein LTR37_008930 [Vermiconidia calcicola]
MPPEDKDSEMEQFAEGLESDRLIDIYVGDRSIPYKVSERLLVCISYYFLRAIKNEHLGNEKSGTLRFPDDDVEAWNALLFFKYWSYLPTCVDPQELRGNEEHRRKLIKYWALGDKYDVKEFQDTVMLQLLRELAHQRTNLEAVKLAFENTAPGSKLRRLYAEEVVYMVEEGKAWNHDHFDTFDGVPGFTSAYMHATNRYKLAEDADEFFHRTGKDGSWRDYMVGDRKDEGEKEEE